MDVSQRNGGQVISAEVASMGLWPPLQIWTVEPHLTQWLVTKLMPGQKSAPLGELLIKTILRIFKVISTYGNLHLDPDLNKQTGFKFVYGCVCTHTIIHAHTYMCM